MGNKRLEHVKVLRARFAHAANNFARLCRQLKRIGLHLREVRKLLRLHDIAVLHDRAGDTEQVHAHAVINPGVARSKVAPDRRRHLDLDLGNGVDLRPRTRVEFRKGKHNFAVEHVGKFERARSVPLQTGGNRRFRRIGRGIGIAHFKTCRLAPLVFLPPRSNGDRHGQTVMISILHEHLERDRVARHRRLLRKRAGERLIVLKFSGRFIDERICLRRRNADRPVCDARRGKHDRRQRHRYHFCLHPFSSL